MFWKQQLLNAAIGALFLMGALAPTAPGSKADDGKLWVVFITVCLLLVASTMAYRACKADVAPAETVEQAALCFATAWASGVTGRRRIGVVFVTNERLIFHPIWAIFLSLGGGSKLSIARSEIVEVTKTRFFGILPAGIVVTLKNNDVYRFRTGFLWANGLIKPFAGRSPTVST